MERVRRRTALGVAGILVASLVVASLAGPCGDAPDDARTEAPRDPSTPPGRETSGRRQPAPTPRASPPPAGEEARSADGGSPADAAPPATGTDEMVVTVVRAQDGAPLEGLTIDKTGDGPLESATTDAEGRCRMRRPRVHVRLRARVDHDIGGRWFLPAEVHVLQGSPSAWLVVAEADLVRGVVVDETGAAVPWVEVEARSAAGRSSRSGAGEHGRFGVPIARGETGTIELTGFTLRPAGFSGGVRTLSPWEGRLEGVRADGGAVVLRATRDPETQTLHVRVLDPAGLPLPGVSVRVPYASPRPMGPVVLTDRDGRQAFSGLLRRPLEITIARHLSPPLLENDWLPPAPLVVEARGQTVELRCSRAVVVAGTVLRSTLQPAVEARIEVYAYSDRAGDAPAGETLTDISGAFRALVPAESAAPFEVVATWPPRDPAERRSARAEDVAPGTTDLRLVLPER